MFYKFSQIFIRVNNVHNVYLQKVYFIMLITSMNLYDCHNHMNDK